MHVDVLKYIEYNPVTGELFLNRSNGTRRKLIPDENLMVITSIDKYRIKMKYNRLCWCIMNKKDIPSDSTIFHKDLDEMNFKGSNLCLMHKDTYKEVQESIKNISGALKIVAHHSDAFCYVLEYRNDGKVHREVFHDVLMARRKLQKLQLRFVKIISKHTLTD